MRIAFQVEGPTDLRVFSTFVERILGHAVEPEVYRKRAGGVNEVFRTLEKSVWDAWRKGCHGAVLSVDANGTTPHASHDDGRPGNCRFCEIQRGLPDLPSRPPQPPLTFAVAVPVQAIEAWLLRFGHLIGRRPPGPPEGMNRHDAKRLLWGAVEPAPSQLLAVLDSIIPAIGPAELEGLAHSQVSFAQFRDAVVRWSKGA